MQRKIIKNRKIIKKHWETYIQFIGKMYKDYNSSKIIQIIEPERKEARIKVYRSIKDYKKDKYVIMSFPKTNLFLYTMGDLGFDHCNEKGEVIW